MLRGRLGFVWLARSQNAESGVAQQQLSESESQEQSASDSWLPTLPELPVMPALPDMSSFLEALPKDLPSIGEAD